MFARWRNQLISRCVDRKCNRVSENWSSSEGAWPEGSQNHSDSQRGRCFCQISISLFLYIYIIIYAHISIVYTYIYIYIYIYCVCVLTAFGCDLLEGSRRFCACHSLWLSSSEFFQSIVFLCVRASIWKRSGSDPSQGVGLAKERTGGCHDMHDEDLQDVNDSTWRCWHIRQLLAYQLHDMLVQDLALPRNCCLKFLKWSPWRTCPDLPVDICVCGEWTDMKVMFAFQDLLLDQNRLRDLPEQVSSDVLNTSYDKIWHDDNQLRYAHCQTSSLCLWARTSWKDYQRRDERGTGYFIIHGGGVIG